MKKVSPPHIDSISALWRGDAPDGIAVRFGFEADDDDGAKLTRWLDDQLATFDENTTVAEVLDELREIAERTDGGADLEQREATTVMAMIHWLEKRGHVATDDANGVTWQAVSDVAKAKKPAARPRLATTAAKRRRPPARGRPRKR